MEGGHRSINNFQLLTITPSHPLRTTCFKSTTTRLAWYLKLSKAERPSSTACHHVRRCVFILHESREELVHILPYCSLLWELTFAVATIVKPGLNDREWKWFPRLFYVRSCLTSLIHIDLLTAHALVNAVEESACDIKFSISRDHYRGRFMRMICLELFWFEISK